LIINLQQV